MRTKLFRRARRGLHALAVLTAAGLCAAPAAAETVKAILSSKLQILDPIATISYSTRTFSYLVYDVLISQDSKGEYRPQMLESWQVSEDGMHYSFKLRAGLKFSDGTPVTAEDCVASIERWGKRDGFGRKMMEATGSLTVTGTDTFELKLAEPFGLVIEALGKPSSNVPAIMPARIARATAPTEKITEVVGSGPFLFRKDEWVPGDRAVFVKNPLYVPRDEPADGLAGGKHVYIDQVEIVSVPDAATQVAALQAGEIDYVERTPLDFIEVLKADPNVKMKIPQGLSQTMGAFVINHLTPPFNDINARRALQALMYDKEFMIAQGLTEEMYTPGCKSMFMCGSTYGSEAGVDALPATTIESAKQFLAKSSYKGEPVRMLLASTVPLINTQGLVMEDRMRRAGFNVEVRASDWGTVAQQRWKKDPTSEGGWNLFPLIWNGYDLALPLTHYIIANNCTDGYAGWSCTEAIAPLLKAFAKERDVEKRKAIARDIQVLAHENASVLLIGQFAPPATYRANLSGFPDLAFPVFWNVKRN